jgi:RES domain-containing protein
MIIYRLATEKYKDDLSGTGAKLFGGRWNSKGIPALYTTENISLSVLEILVRTDKQTIPLSYHLIKLSIPDTVQVVAITADKLKKGWKDDIGYTQWMGDEFIKSGSSLLLKVPSAIVEDENNYLINTMHPDFKKIKILAATSFHFDKRLFIGNE